MSQDPSVRNKCVHSFFCLNIVILFCVTWTPSDFTLLVLEC
jgi:hypothetical protein